MSSPSSPTTPPERTAHRVRAARIARTAGWVAVAAASLLAAGFYLAQNMTLAPWENDGGLILGYIDQVAHGQRPFFDFVDAYGPLNWYLPAWFYRAYGDEVWGVRVLIWLLKLASVTLVFELVRRLGRTFYAVLAALWVMVLLGLPWHYMQTAYAFHQALPLILLTWLFLLARPLARPDANVALAGAATASVIWLKLNTGVFLLAAGLLCCLCWLPSGHRPDGPRWMRWQGRFRVVQWAGIGFGGLVFAAFMRAHFDRYYLLYLAIPLGLAVTAAAIQVAADRRQRAPVGGLARATAVHLAAVVAISGAFVVGYFGPAAFVRYAAELASILSSLDYAYPLPPLGEAGIRVGFNEYYWLQLPWLVTAVYALWWGVAGRGRGSDGETAARRRALHSLFVYFALGSFVVYSRSDEPHVFQAVVPAVPALFVYVSDLERALAGRPAPGAVRRYGWIAFRGVVAVAALAYVATIADAPGPLRWGPGDWSQASLRHLDYRPHPLWRHPVPARVLRAMDRATDQAARYIDDATPDGSEVLVLTRNELLNYLSHTRPAGGRYKYVFYLAKSGLIDRDAFHALVPGPILEALESDPPAIVVGGLQDSTLMNAMPELEPVIRQRYHVARRFGGLVIFARNDGDESGGSSASQEAVTPGNDEATHTAPRPDR